MKKKKEWICLITGFLGSLLGVYAVASLNRLVPVSLPLGLRMLAIPAIYWLIALVPIIIMIINKDKLSDYGFSREKIGYQIITGIGIGIAMSFFLTLLPHLVGFGGYVDNGKRYQYIWQFLYEFCYCIISIGCVEEFVFRGFIYEKIMKISQKNLTAILVSSILFGAFHFLSGNIVQMLITACIGALFCLFRTKIKHCSVLSLIIAHGIYDALITVWASVFL